MVLDKRAQKIYTSSITDRTAQSNAERFNMQLHNSQQRSPAT